MSQLLYDRRPMHEVFERYAEFGISDVEVPSRSAKLQTNLHAEEKDPRNVIAVI